jgi:hypothetical protein
MGEMIDLSRTTLTATVTIRNGGRNILDKDMGIRRYVPRLATAKS